jgi:hypothetical protein
LSRLDGIVRGIPSFAKLLFDPQVKERMHVQNQNDFSLGFALGMIQCGCGCEISPVVRYEIDYGFEGYVPDG